LCVNDRYIVVGVALACLKEMVNFCVATDPNDFLIMDGEGCVGDDAQWAICTRNGLLCYGHELPNVAYDGGHVQGAVSTVGCQGATSFPL
jgi:hypothetical protein